jgi:membrane protein YdbS with pleckstrin-like domain
MKNKEEKKRKKLRTMFLIFSILAFASSVFILIFSLFINDTGIFIYLGVAGLLLLTMSFAFHLVYLWYLNSFYIGYLNRGNKKIQKIAQLFLILTILTCISAISVVIFLCFINNVDSIIRLVIVVVLLFDISLMFLCTYLRYSNKGMFSPSWP